MIKSRILIIDDDPDVQLLLKNYLLQSGYEPGNIIFCKSYHEVASTNTRQVDIVLTDLDLPDSKSHETFTRVKELFPDIPVIVITASAEAGFAYKTLVQGAEDYLEKSRLTKDILERAIRYALLRAQGASDYRSLFEENPVPMFILTEDDFRVLAANKAAQYQYGYSLEEFLKLTALDIRPREDKQEFLSAYEKPFKNFKDLGYWRHKRKDGSLFYVQIYAHAITFQGIPARLSMALDVNESITYKWALEKKAKETENILRSITDGFLAVDSEHRFTYVNRAFEKLLQKNSEDVVGRVIWDVFPEAKETVFYYNYFKIIEEKKSVHFEALYEPLDIYLAVSGYPSEDGVSVFFVDITEKKQLEHSIFLNEQNLRATIDNTEDLIWSVDRELNIISANASYHNRMRQIVGHEVKTLKKEYFSAESFREWMGYYERVFSGEKFQVIRITTYQGVSKYEDVRFNPMRDQSGQVSGASCVARDITAQQQHLMMIEAQNEKLREINWIQSHELRKPVANILGLSALINKKELSGNPELMQLLEYIEISARDLDKVIRKIIDPGT